MGSGNIAVFLCVCVYVFVCIKMLDASISIPGNLVETAASHLTAFWDSLSEMS